MNRRWIAMTLAAAVAVASGAAMAQRGGGGGGGGGGQGHGGGWQGGGGGNHGSWQGGGGGYRGGWHGGGYRGGYYGGYRGGWYGWRGGYTIAIGAPYWYWGAWPYSYYYPYYAPAYYPAYSYPYSYPAYPAYSGNAWYVDGASTTGEPYRGATTPPPTPAAPRAAPAQTYRYYCPDTGYYPEVASCAKGWLRVVPDAPPQ